MKTGYKILLTAILGSLQMQFAAAQKVGDFRSNASGTWTNKPLSLNTNKRTNAVNTNAVATNAAAATSSWQQLQTVSGTNWLIQSQATAGTNGAAIATVGYNTSGWVTGTVPGTVFASYVAAGQVNGSGWDPNMGNNIYNTAWYTKFDKPFWYRTEFSASSLAGSTKLWLNLNGVNKRAYIYLNGHYIGKMSGLYQRAKFDVTGILSTSATNALAIWVTPPTYTGSHDIMNWESPTYVMAKGWDWMPRVPGLESGIVDDVFISGTGPVTIEDPWVRASLPTLTTANLSVNLTVRNSTGASSTGVIKGVINPGNITFTTGNITVAANSTQNLTYTTSNFPQLAVSNPQLWWPNGYGSQPLYTCYVHFDVGGTTLSDSVTKSFGIRKMAYDTTTLGGPLRISVNNVPIFVKGGDWGMSEYLLRERGSAYDISLRLHKEMNFNMIRNWCGAVTDDAFYNYCDKYGIMVWDDFWLQNFAGIDSITMFNASVIEKVKRLRNHPSVAVWCGANENVPGGDVNSSLNTTIQNALTTYDGNDRRYEPRSNSGRTNSTNIFAPAGSSKNLSGSGDWQNYHPKFYFTYAYNGYTNPSNNYRWGHYGFRTELGTCVWPNIESLQKYIPSANLVVPTSAAIADTNNMYSRHFFGNNINYGSANPSRYIDTLNAEFGTSSSLDIFCKKAQLLNIEVNKAMYEGWNEHMWADASGVINWMSQAAYPTMKFQTYDYYYDLTGAYFGCKSACEPEHLQWNPSTNGVKLINNRNFSLLGVTAEAIVYNKTGQVAQGYYKRLTTNVGATSATAMYNIFTSPYNVSYGVPAAQVTASSSIVDPLSSVVDGNPTGLRWGSNYNNTEWIQIDLGSTYNVNGATLAWEAAYGSAYDIETSTDGSTWTHHNFTGRTGGTETVNFTAINARYVRMQGVTRGTSFGYSLYEFTVLSTNAQALTDVHFVRLKLSDVNGPVSTNFYLRGTTDLNYTGLNSLASAGMNNITIPTTLSTLPNGNKLLTYTLTNSSSVPAVGIRMKLYYFLGTPVLPAIYDDNYFTLMPGESKTGTIEVPAASLPGSYGLNADAYNN